MVTKFIIQIMMGSTGIVAAMDYHHIINPRTESLDELTFTSSEDYLFVLRTDGVDLLYT